MKKMKRLGYGGFKASVVGVDCEIHDLERAKDIINQVARVPYSITSLLKISVETSVPKFICKSVQDIALLHERFEIYEDMYGSISQTLPVSIECFDGFFRLHKSDGGQEYLQELAYYGQAKHGISSIVKEYSNGDEEELKIADVEDCLEANFILQNEWSLSEHGYGKPACIPAGEYFPPLSAFYIEEVELQFFIEYFVHGQKEADTKTSLEPIKKNHKAWIIQRLEKDLELPLSGSNGLTYDQAALFKEYIRKRNRGYRASLLRDFTSWYETNREEVGNTEGKTPFNNAWRELGLIKKDE